jgi:hypothetical protein
LSACGARQITEEWGELNINWHLEAFCAFYTPFWAAYGETHAVCLRHPVLTRKSRSRRPSEYEIVEKSRSPHHDFSKNKESWLFFVFQK